VAVTVKIPTQLRAATGGEAEVEVNGDLRRFVNVYVSGEDIRFQQGLETAISEGDEVTILPAVAGGC
jgi:molybdopterin converting factor small subunit